MASTRYVTLRYGSVRGSGAEQRRTCPPRRRELVYQISGVRSVWGQGDSYGNIPLPKIDEARGRYWNLMMVMGMEGRSAIGCEVVYYCQIVQAGGRE